MRDGVLAVVEAVLARLVRRHMAMVRLALATARVVPGSFPGAVLGDHGVLEQTDHLVGVDAMVVVEVGARDQAHQKGNVPGDGGGRHTIRRRVLALQSTLLIETSSGRSF